MKRLFGAAIGAAVLALVGSAAVTPADAAQAPSARETSPAVGTSTGVEEFSAQRRRYYRRYYRPYNYGYRPYYRPRYYAPRPYYYGGPRVYGPGFSFGF